MSEAQVTAREDYQSLTPRGEVSHLLGTVSPSRVASQSPRQALRWLYLTPPGRVAALVRFAPQVVAPGVRGCVACRRRPGPSKSREEHHRWASPITSRTTAGRTKDRRGGETYMARRSFHTESHDPLGSAVGKDSDEALHCTIQIMPFAGNSNLATVV